MVRLCGITLSALLAHRPQHLILAKMQYMEYIFSQCSIPKYVTFLLRNVPVDAIGYNF
jgi:hypothetical protein